MHSRQPAKKLSLEEQAQFEELVEKSIIARYDGNLERWEGRDGGPVYTPLDTDHVRTLLNALWGELLTPQAIDDAFERLAEGENEWPHGYCEDDIEEQWQSISSCGPE